MDLIHNFLDANVDNNDLIREIIYTICIISFCLKDMKVQYPLDKKNSNEINSYNNFIVKDVNKYSNIPITPNEYLVVIYHYTLDISKVGNNIVLAIEDTINHINHLIDYEVVKNNRYLIPAY